MFKKNTGDRYHKAIKKLTAAEAAHAASLDALDDALMNRRSGDVPRCRRAAQETERALIEALEAAAIAHRAYWMERREAMVPSVREAALLFRRFNRVARCAADASSDPALTLVQSVLGGPCEPIDILDDAGVPAEGPDSELLDERRGSWKGA